ncbi:MAG: polysaccharide deacetylase [Oscillospiraceae bacterium]|nr:polysaccharide deacetylase [Oscillospiraceae bacterium]
MIFLVVCILILVPTVLAVRFHHEAVLARNTLIADDAPSHGSPESVFEPDGTEIEEPAEVDAPEEPSYTADAPSYQLLYEDFYASQPYGATERVENTVYLTFDDGPSERTDEILDVLAEKNVKATFFVIGHEDEANWDRLRRIVAEGHTLGMHSYTHDYAKVYASVESFLDEFYRIFKQIQEVTGTTPTAFRFPGGSINGYDGGFYQEIISEMIRRGFVPYDWNISSEDAATGRILPADTLVSNVVRNADGKVRCFVLFHDNADKTTSAQAVGPVIDRLRDMGFSFAAIAPSTLPVLYSYPE